MNLAGKNVLLTGAASGIGAALLRLLCTEAAHITCVDIDSAALQATIAALPPHTAVITPFVGDLALPVTVEDMISAALAQMGSIDIVIANAGFAYYERVDYQDWQRIEQIFRVNVFSPIYTLQVMQQRFPSGGYMAVLVASAMSYIAVPGYSLYAATKAAVDRFAEGYRFDMPPNTQLMVVYPVATRSGFFQRAGSQVPVIPPTQTPDQVARVIVQGIRRNAKRVYPHPVFRLFRLSMLTLTAMRYLTYQIGLRQFREWLKRQ
jgi:short-subunit dehydrogenase